jgi:hypothetical protein
VLIPAGKSISVTKIERLTMQENHFGDKSNRVDEDPGFTKRLAEADAFVARFLERTASWDAHPDDLVGGDDLPWSDPDHSDERLDAAYCSGIIAPDQPAPAAPRAGIDAALAYVRRGWRVFPCHSIVAGACSCGDRACGNPGKHPRIGNGCNGASRDPRQIRDWWRRWPDANPAIATGEGSGIFVVDIDAGKGGTEHLARLVERQGQGPLPDTFTIRSGGGGWHFYYSWPDADVRNSAGKLAVGVDVRGTGGYVIAAPSNHVSGGFYDVDLNIEPVPAPAWLIAALTEVPQPDQSPRPSVQLPLSRYGETALDNAVERIVHASDHEQRDTLNREAFGIARLVAGGVIPSPLALEALHWAARQMPSYDSRRPWRAVDLQKTVDTAFLAGLQRPWQPDNRRVRA